MGSLRNHYCVESGVLFHSVSTPSQMLNNEWAFPVMWLFIVVVSVHDGYLALIYRPTMTSMEVNPLGRWLIDANGGDVALLLLVKGLGTFCAAALLLLLYWTRPGLGW